MSSTKRPLKPPASPSRAAQKSPPKAPPKVERVSNGFLLVAHPAAGSRTSAASSSSSDSGIDSPAPVTVNPCAQDSLDSLFSYDTIVDEFSERVSEAWPMKCSYVVKELLQTERVYVQDLGEIIKGYLSPLYSHLLSSGEGPNFIRTVFSNIVKIHHVHMELLDCLQSSCTNTHNFGRCFLDCDFLSVYTAYCTNFSKANDCLEEALLTNRTLKEFIEQCQQELGHPLPLSHQLIKPVQRILKYRLMLEELSKHYDYQNDAHATLQDALTKMSSVAEKINTAFQSQPKKTQKASPSSIAKKKAMQIKDLQKSRSLPRRRTSSVDPNEDLIPGSKSFSFGKRPSTPGGTPTLHRIARHAVKSSEGLNSIGLVWEGEEGEEEGGGGGGRSGRLPSVSDLKNYFEKLGHTCSRSKVIQGVQRASSAASMYSTSLNTSPKHSPKAATKKRRNSVGRATELSVTNPTSSGSKPSPTHTSSSGSKPSPTHITSRRNSVGRATELSVSKSSPTHTSSSGNGNGCSNGGGVYAAAIQSQHICNAGIVASEIRRINGIASASQYNM